MLVDALAVEPTMITIDDLQALLEWRRRIRGYDHACWLDAALPKHSNNERCWNRNKKPGRGSPSRAERTTTEKNPLF
jgi:hypothetical protein